VTPRASRAAIGGIAALSDGTAVLKVAVTVAPEDGKANAAVVEMLARAWKLPKSSIDIVSGATSRLKTVHIAGRPAELLVLLDAWAAALA
jgi:uncharacterized protein (TIGR00251 family)